jgi:hypothetical protein
MKKSSKKTVYTIITALVLMSIIALSLYVFFSIDKNSNESSSDSQTINYDPPSDEEVAAGDERKKQIVSEDASATPADSESTGNIAEIVVVDANQYDDIIEVRAFVQNIVEEGTCTYIFSKDSTEFVKSSPARADASTTPCITLTVPREEFSSSGEWKLTINYSGAAATGSAETSLEIQ